MNQFARKVHLWVGLILAIVLLMEAVTGLILSEPGLVGQEKTQRPPERQAINTAERKAPETGEPQARSQAGVKPMTATPFSLAKSLHQGRIGNWNLKWLIDLSAIGLAVLVLTGVYIAIPRLKARRKY